MTYTSDQTQPADAKRTRTIATGGRRVGVRLEPETWTAIDVVAGKHGLKWQEWARRVMDMYPDAVNLTGLLRTAAMNELLGAITLAEREFTPPSDDVLPHPFLNAIYAVQRDVLLDEVSKAHIVYTLDLTGFVLHVGFHGDNPVQFIENKLVDGLSLITELEQ